MNFRFTHLAGVGVLGVLSPGPCAGMRFFKNRSVNSKIEIKLSSIDFIQKCIHKIDGLMKSRVGKLINE